MLAYEFHIFYRETKATGERAAFGRVHSVTGCAQSEQELRQSLEDAGLQVISISKLRPLVDWSKPYFNREEFAHLVGWSSATVSRQRGSGTIPRSEFSTGLYPAKWVEKMIENQANEAGKEILNQLKAA